MNDQGSLEVSSRLAPAELMKRRSHRMKSEALTVKLLKVSLIMG